MFVNFIFKTFFQRFFFIFSGPNNSHQFRALALGGLPRALSLDTSFNSHFRDFEHSFKSATVSRRTVAPVTTIAQIGSSTLNNNNSSGATGSNGKLDCQGYNPNLPQGAQGKIFIAYILCRVSFVLQSIAPRFLLSTVGDENGTKSKLLSTVSNQMLSNLILINLIFSIFTSQFNATKALCLANL